MRSLWIYYSANEVDFDKKLLDLTHDRGWLRKTVNAMERLIGGAEKMAEIGKRCSESGKGILLELPQHFGGIEAGIGELFSAGERERLKGIVERAREVRERLKNVGPATVREMEAYLYSDPALVKERVESLARMEIGKTMRFGTLNLLVRRTLEHNCADSGLLARRWLGEALNRAPLDKVLEGDDCWTQRVWFFYAERRLAVTERLWRVTGDQGRLSEMLSDAGSLVDAVDKILGRKRTRCTGEEEKIFVSSLVHVRNINAAYSEKMSDDDRKRMDAIREKAESAERRIVLLRLFRRSDVLQGVGNIEKYVYAKPALTGEKPEEVRDMAPDPEKFPGIFRLLEERCVEKGGVALGLIAHDWIGEEREKRCTIIELLQHPGPGDERERERFDMTESRFRISMALCRLTKDIRRVSQTAVTFREYYFSMWLLLERRLRTEEEKKRLRSILESFRSFRDEVYKDLNPEFRRKTDSILSEGSSMCREMEADDLGGRKPESETRREKAGSPSQEDS